MIRKLALRRIHERTVPNSLSAAHPSTSRQPAVVLTRHHADLARTLQTGKDIPQTVQGHNYAPIFYEDSAQTIARPTGALYIQNMDGDKDKDGNVISYFPRSRGIKTQHYTLALYIDKSHKLVQTLLFDDVNDPYQLHNLTPETHPEIVKELYKELATQLKAIDDPWYQEKILSDILPY